MTNKIKTNKGSCKLNMYVWKERKKATRRRKKRTEGGRDRGREGLVGTLETPLWPVPR
jgi:hypothetical protein